MKEGGKEAIRADDEVVAKAEILALQKQTRELQRVLGNKTPENEILREAVKRAAKSPRPFYRRRSPEPSIRGRCSEKSTRSRGPFGGLEINTKIFSLHDQMFIHQMRWPAVPLPQTSRDVR
jgi:hypothetical protein